MNSISTLTLILSLFLLLTAPPCHSTRPESSLSTSSNLKQTNKGSNKGSDSGSGGGAGGGGGEIPGFPGFNIPGFEGTGGGYGFGVGGPSGGYGKGGVFATSVVCKDRGPCFHKKLTCPAKCFSSYSRSGKGYGMGGGGGGCTVDCKKKCRAYC